MVIEVRAMDSDNCVCIIIPKETIDYVSQTLPLCGHPCACFMLHSFFYMFRKQLRIHCTIA